MIIDCHGHYTTAPRAHADWRAAQKAAYAAGVAPPPYPGIGDDDIRASVEGSQLKLMAERGIDLTIFSPRAFSSSASRAATSTPTPCRPWCTCPR